MLYPVSWKCIFRWKSNFIKIYMCVLEVQMSLQQITSHVNFIQPIELAAFMPKIGATSRFVMKNSKNEKSALQQHRFHSRGKPTYPEMVFKMKMWYFTQPHTLTFSSEANRMSWRHDVEIANHVKIYWVELFVCVCVCGMLCTLLKINLVQNEENS